MGFVKSSQIRNEYRKYKQECQKYKQFRKYRDPEETSDNNDSWDGSLDNQEKILEEHVSERGWEF